MAALHVLLAVDHTIPGIIIVIVLIAVLPPPLQLRSTAKSAAGCPRPTLLRLVVPPRRAKLADTLRKVHVNPTVVDQHILHLRVGGFAGTLVLVLYKGVLEAVPGLSVANYFAAQNSSETAEDKL